MSKKADIKKILCIKPRGIGDIILSTIILENIKAAYPHSEIHYLTEEFAKRAVENNPFVSKVLTFKKKDFVISILSKVRKAKYDLVFDFWSNPKTAQITFFSGAKYRAGYNKRGRKYAYNIKANPGNTNTHAAESNLQLLKEMQIPIVSKKTLFFLNDKEKTYAKDFIASNFEDELTIGIIPSGGWKSKRCEPEKWIEICNAMLTISNLKFLILWGPGDEDDANKIKNNLHEKSVLIPETNVGQLAGLISECDLVIANDSGPMHIAAAMEVPVIGIFGPTNPVNHKPYSTNSDYVIKDDLDCIICNKLSCPYSHECMKNLLPEEIVVKIKKLLKIT
ncbi:MAG: glycosyltransferase family 9 protein [Ignavibacteria bacterium]|nr:glycosyltransferase family 9 protein [Ignavibacteria bacterium]MBT8383303.1 glycosyltransferase family 9 protein [Ignavibacteria bacterium]MBT8393152.1 glycosyltransferase family 9 protein [Ignavibacteria bacterium]NNJ51832.1 glycosyltransferase family 9 protein [Ignavibacteriaceae bacterium]NNL20906.1 glycosyltransferase family 9 protein [Ignavibacteriaceae bacterium]